MRFPGENIKQQKIAFSNLQSNEFTIQQQYIHWHCTLINYVNETTHMLQTYNHDAL